MQNRLGRLASQAWSPAYFLASVGAGGLSVSFFMYLMFWVPHAGRPVPVFEDVVAAFLSGALIFRGAIVVGVIGIAVFAAMNIVLLVWNLSQLRSFHAHGHIHSLRKTNGHSQELALPLALAMSVNTLFVIGLVFVPGLWANVEYLFPLSIIAFALIGVLALRLLGQFLVRVVVRGDFDMKANSGFAQMLPAFAFAMIGVGLSAPAAMSANAGIAGLSLVLSTFFLISSFLLAAIALVHGTYVIWRDGVSVEQSPTLLIVVPMVTVLGILMLRQDHGMHVHFGRAESAGELFVFLTSLLAIQIGFLLVGTAVLKSVGYIARFVTGSDASVGSYALICPGVALSVLLQFWINKGLVGAGLVDKFGAIYWMLTGVALALQFAMILLLLVLNRKHFSSAPQPVAA